MSRPPDAAGSGLYEQAHQGRQDQKRPTVVDYDGERALLCDLGGISFNRIPGDRSREVSAHDDDSVVCASLSSFVAKLNGLARAARAGPCNDWGVCETSIVQRSSRCFDELSSFSCKFSYSQW